MAHGKHGNMEIRNNGYTDFLGPAEIAALGIPKGDACYRRDARNHGNHRN